MPWTYAIKNEVNLIFTKGSGVVTDDELLLGVDSAYRDPEFSPNLNAFLDYSEVTDWKVSGQTLSLLASKRKFSDKTKTAIFVTGRLSFGMSRIYHAGVEKGQVKICQDRAEALAWLNEGMPPEKVIT